MPRLHWERQSPPDGVGSSREAALGRVALGRRSPVVSTSNQRRAGLGSRGFPPEAVPWRAPSSDGPPTRTAIVRLSGWREHRETKTVSP